MDSTFISTEYDGKARTCKSATCSTCHKVYVVPLHRAAKQKCCSPECGNVYRRRTRVELTCAQCGNKTQKSPSKLLNSRSGLYFCKRACKDQAQRIGGIEEIQPDHYGLINPKREYRKRAYRIYERKCAHCGYRDESKMLDVHHRDGDRSNNLIENLEVLCVWCHALITRKQKPHPWNGKLCFVTSSIPTRST